MCAVPPSLSQLTTSFIASQSQGIHHAPLVALKNLNIVVCYPTTNLRPPLFTNSDYYHYVIDKKADFRLTTFQLIFSNMSKNLNHLAKLNSLMIKKMFKLRTHLTLNVNIFGLKELFLKVEDIGVEPMTLCVQGRCSSQLS